MTFYIKPPRGSIPLEQFQELGRKRLQFLQKLVSTGGSFDRIKSLVEEASVVEDSDCFIDGTMKDRISHFVLRLASVNNRAMHSFLIQAESLLFSFRVSCHTLDEKQRMLQDLYRHTTTTLSERFLTSDLNNVLATIRSVLKQYRKERHKNLLDLVFQVPFYCALDFVRNREVELQNGVAYLQWSQFDKLLVSFFEMTITSGFEQMASSACLFHLQEDLRLKRVCRRLQNIFLQNSYKKEYPLAGPRSPLTQSNIDDLSHYFPLCMNHLHSLLRRHHRLRHTGRIQYTLYLKEIGLPVEEAIKFWEKEYSQPPTCGHSSSLSRTGCSHEWSKDHRRYVYNVRHLYGCEGGRKDYSAHCCGALQTRLVATSDDGGCPFAGFDKSYLRSILLQRGLKEQDVGEIESLVAKEDFRGACIKYFWSQVERYNKKEKERPCPMLLD
ncbi:DNA primase large subunit-like isoform X2 [Limulus polyphemus]|nr:DNA primase large subunit-like isoform X2 [Limulus polyphemus]XP_022249831.1 DNA primase large subunit-like isoform X2 [Limulus polyphemus]